MRIMRSFYLSVCEVVTPELPKLCGAPRGAFYFLGEGGGANCLYKRHIYFERNTGQDKIYILVGTLCLFEICYSSFSTSTGSEI
jgi:hypothetical protein